MLGLALALRQRGHEVTLATNDYYRDHTQRQGLPLEALGDRQQFLDCTANPALWHPRRAFPYLYRSLQPVMRAQYELFSRYAAEGDFLGITNCLGFGALLARERWQFPVLTLHCQPAVVWSDQRPPRLAGISGPPWLRRWLFRLGEKWVVDATVCPSLNAWRQELKLPPVRRIVRWWNSPDGILCTFPSWFAAPAADWPTPCIQTDFPLWNDRRQAELPSAAQAFLEGGSPPIVFAPGSANVHARAFFTAGVDACQRLGARGLFLTEFTEQLPQPLPATILAVPYAPLDLILPRAKAIVYHGGIGTLSQAILAGIPQVVMPMAHDQFDNAERIERLGVGARLLPQHFRGSLLVRQLTKLLNDPSTRDRCLTLAARLQPGQGLSATALAVEELAGLGVR